MVKGDKNRKQPHQLSFRKQWELLKATESSHGCKRLNVITTNKIRKASAVVASREWSFSRSCLQLHFILNCDFLKDFLGNPVRENCSNLGDLQIKQSEKVFGSVPDGKMCFCGPVKRTKKLQFKKPTLIGEKGFKPVSGVNAPLHRGDIWTLLFDT